MFIANATFSKGLKVDLGTDPNEPIRVQFGENNDGFSIYFSRKEALELYSGLEKAIHCTAENQSA